MDRVIEVAVWFISAALTYEYFALPCVSAIYNVRYPTTSPTVVKLAYTLSFTAVLTAGEVILQKATRLVAYIHWSWYVSFISICIALQLSYLFYKWFTGGSVVGNKA
ncbi:CBO0543 family protein [Paenibacillus aestuarii]|uniref:CBO0543 family protein n=1 Tax=Paenibacillus aestuarii TaxID=516965 RepID=A0ABW0KEK6_9BACL|nr:CBO0543 family protein [Paenibacillus aestuarii]